MSEIIKRGLRYQIKTCKNIRVMTIFINIFALED